MTYQAQTSIGCTDAAKYTEMLRKHFAQKVETKKDEHESIVFFAMGECTMNWKSGDMQLHCRAKHESALEIVVKILESHLHMIREIKGQDIQWTKTTV